jgi:hypothetical protein
MSDFYKTRMGQRFYERTMPDLVKQLERLNELLARLVGQQDQRDEEKR